MSKMRKKLLFIINPISGGKNKRNFEQQAKHYLNHELFDAQYRFTERPNHGAELAEEAVNGNYDVVVAVGGDGTVNEIAKALVNTSVVLGIVPEGSGNGLATFLEIPSGVKEAIAILNRFQIKAIDSGVLNGHSFFNMAGIGFDAVISNRFDKESIRGPYGYMKTVFSEITSYKSQVYDFIIDGKKFKREAFMISLANSSQYGNNAHVSPKASVSDGLLDVCIVKPFPLYLFPKMLFHLFNKTADKSEYIDIIRGKEIFIKRAVEGDVHVDGQPILLGKDLEITVHPKSLQVIY
ncbi:YegS/Rv2252/BmrU family lipid kinase [Albibacterium bauzanense]|uniref:YegS/Rv2252/BmrU family lipid kinase n=2 Tax=Albibacterium bauzanense TaxID=653929 RepID=A0A4R1LU26_9SPHI|nr:YegS/Rv2252/BmrU family lipid kinase [Albibacterium bauzanense]